MGGKIQYVCIHCGNQRIHRASEGELPNEMCPRRNDGGNHFWVKRKNLSENFRKMLKSIDENIDGEYMYCVAQCYENRGSVNDIEIAINWYKKAANLGHGTSACLLGMMYRKGEVVPKNIEESIVWYKKSAALGCLDAMLSLGEMYENGEDAPQDIEEAEKWYKEAANMGSVKGKLCLGRIYEFSNEIKKAFYIYYEVAKTFSVPPSFIILVYRGPRCLPGHSYIVDVMRQTDENDASDMARRGYAYEHGLCGVEKDLAKAYDWYERAADAGNGYAMFVLGSMYLNSEQENIEKAYEYFRKAALSGSNDNMLLKVVGLV